jgi:ATP-dependent Clp protease adaptor protein ClpS
MSKEHEISRSQRHTLPDPPSMYTIVLLNDDFTPYDWVLKLLDVFFHKSGEDALRIAREIDETGGARVGVYTRDVAETKCIAVLQASHMEGHPLQARIERQ